jgi:hypothetical protein
MPILHTSGARFINTPISPSWAGKATNVAAQSNTGRSGVMTLHWNESILAIEDPSANFNIQGSNIQKASGGTPVFAGFEL